MGAMQTLTNPASIAYAQQTFLDGVYMKALMYKLKVHKYGVQKTVPANNGSTTVRYFRRRKANTTYVNRLGTDYNEGVVPTNIAEVARGYVDVFLTQQIWYNKISDLELATDKLQPVKTNTKVAGEDMALDYDEICMNCMFANPAIAGNKVNSSQTTLYNSDTYFERFAGVDQTGDSSTDFATFNALTSAQGKISRAFHLGCLTQLEENDVPLVNNRYPAITHPRVINDMRQDSSWFSAAVFNAEALKLFPGGEFELDGGIFVATTRGWREAATYGTRDNTGSNFGVAYLGEEAFVVPKLSSGAAGGGGGEPIILYNDKVDAANPARQFATITAKSYYGAAWAKTNESSDVSHVVLGRVKSTFVG